MAIDVADIADIANTTIASFDKLKFSEIAATDEEHHFLPQLIDGENVKYEGGDNIKFDVMVDDSGGARNIGYFDKEQIVVRDVMKQGSVPWRRTVSPFAMDVLEIAINSGDANKIIDLVQTRRAAAFLALSNLVETDGWAKPTSSTDTITPFGLKYWMTKSITGTSAGTSNGGFNGGNPSGFSAGAAGIDSAAVATWANWTHQYTDVTKADLVFKMRLAAHRTNFKSPIKGKFTPNVRGPDKKVWYMPYLKLNALETLAEQQNENLGNDIASKDGETLFHKNPMRAVSKLDDDTDNPIYAVNWSVIYIVLLRGMALQETKVKPIAGMTETVGANIRLVWNTKCVNRRRLAVLTTAADND
ncbi:MAG: phage major capsid protein [Candidatus Hydrogenedentes bacterium]|nr:phage major capsid protein [Candidatus Hydrogenedentota bacterium]